MPIDSCTISTIPDHSFISSFPYPFPFPPCTSSPSHSTKVEMDSSLHPANQIEMTSQQSTVNLSIPRAITRCTYSIEPAYHQTLQITPINEPTTNQIRPKRVKVSGNRIPIPSPPKKKRNKNQSRSMRCIMTIWAPKILLCPSKMLSLTMVRPCGHFNVLATPFRSNIGIIPKCKSDQSFMPSWPVEKS